jgi:hypothetical protein
MRTVSFVNGRLSISDDSANVLRDLMECIFSPSTVEKIQERFAENGEGIFIPRIVGAWRVRDVKDGLPRYMWDDPPVNVYNQEIWIVENDPEGDLVLIKGDELRSLIRDSWQVLNENNRELIDYIESKVKKAKSDSEISKIDIFIHNKLNKKFFTGLCILYFFLTLYWMFTYTGLFRYLAEIQLSLFRAYNGKLTLFAMYLPVLVLMLIFSNKHKL